MVLLRCPECNKGLKKLSFKNPLTSNWVLETKQKIQNQGIKEVFAKDFHLCRSCGSWYLRIGEDFVLIEDEGVREKDLEDLQEIKEGNYCPV